MPSRRPHQKSRHGCIQCKASKVKCDELRPVCSRCTKKEQGCEYTSLADSSASKASPASIGTRLAFSPALSETADRRRDQSATSTSVPWSPSIEDLELLHHYATSTYVTLADRDDIREMWQVIIPRTACKHTFLLHSLLSVSALHLASAQTTNPAQYVATAIRHHDLALVEYRSSLDNINSANCLALFTCSTLVVVFAFGFSLSRVPHGEELKTPVEEISNIFLLLRGTHVVLRVAWQWMEEGELGSLFKSQDPDHRTQMPPEVMASFRSLQQFNNSSYVEPCNRQTYEAAIERLQECYINVFLKQVDKIFALSWPILVEPSYIVLLRAREPMALAILAHYAVVLDVVKERWWSMGWGEQLLFDISQLVSADWQLLLSWPLKVVKERSSLPSW